MSIGHAGDGARASGATVAAAGWSGREDDHPGVDDRTGCNIGYLSVRSVPRIDYNFLSVSFSSVIVWVGVAASVHNRFITMM